MAPPRLIASHATSSAAPFCKTANAERPDKAHRGAEEPAAAAS